MEGNNSLRIEHNIIGVGNNWAPKQTPPTMKFKQKVCILEVALNFENA